MYSTMLEGCNSKDGSSQLAYEFSEFDLSKLTPVVAPSPVLG